VAKEKKSELEAGDMTSMTLSAFLEKLSSEEPVPGGGSVAALSGALGAALITMYCRIGMNQQMTSRNAQDVLQNIVVEASQLQAKLAKMITEDSCAYGEVMKAFKLPKSTSEEKNRRQAAIQNAFRHAIEAPLQTFQMCVECVSLIPQVGPCGNPSAFSDLKVAQYLCQAGAKGALENIEINLPYIKDSNFLSEVKANVSDLRRALEQAVKKKIEKPT
jgi:methenyltetrahydrofolate cyclohydrolase